MSRIVACSSVGIMRPPARSRSPRRRRCTSAATPFFFPYCFSAAISVTMIRAPEAPIGWPSAQAPPWTLTLSCGRPSSRMAIIATTAKASLISHRSTSPAASRPCSSSARTRRPARRGISPAGRRRWNGRGCVASGVRPRFSASERRIRTSAAAPSEIERGIGRRHRAALAEGGLQRRDFFRLGLQRLLVDGDRHVALAALDRRPARFRRSKLPSLPAFSARVSEASA